MGRLFWKLFLILWLAQISTVLGVGAFFWFRHHLEQSDNRAAQWHHPKDQLLLDVAAGILQHDGAAGLKVQLQGWPASSQALLFVQDEHGQELLGRRLPVRDGGQPPAAERVVSLPDGSHYRLLLDFSPFGGPGGGPDGMHAPSDMPPPVSMAANSPPVGMMPGPAEHGGPDGPSGDDHPPGGPDPFPMVPVLAALLASLLFGALLARYLSKPIRLMSEAFQSVAQGQMEVHLSARLGQRSDELADLGRDFDSLAQRLKHLIGGQRRLFHDVSHELRSPLARLSAAVDLARQQPERLDEWLERIEREAGRMDALVGQILALARLDAETGQAEVERMPLRWMLEELVDDAEFEAGSYGCSVQLSASEEAEVMAQPELLARAVENVVRNAIHHTASGSTVCVGLSCKEDRALITIRDDGPGVPEEELRAIFEPFFRSEHTGVTPGYGLGLAMAHRIVEAHHGQLRAENRPEGGLLVSISLPLA